MNEHLKAVFADLKAQQQAGIYHPCPRCGEQMDEELVHNALSRRQNGIYICSNCGMAEAIEDFVGCHMPLEEWALFSMPTDSREDTE